MNKDKIKALAMELYKNEEVAIELANVIFGIRDGDYDKPKKFEFKFEDNDTYFIEATDVLGGYSGDDEIYLKNGRYRTTEEGAELSLKRNQRANRLEMLVEYLGALEEFVEDKDYWFIVRLKGIWEPKHTHAWYEPEKVYMTKAVAKAVCDLLNTGAYSLDVE